MWFYKQMIVLASTYQRWQVWESRLKKRQSDGWGKYRWTWDLHPATSRLCTTLLCPRPTVFGPCPDGGILFIGTVVSHKWVTLVTTFIYEDIVKEFAYVSIVGFALKTQSVNVAEEHIEFNWTHRTQNFDGCVQFCLQDCVTLMHLQ